EKAYYLCSVADKVYVNPKGAVEYNGMTAQYMFFKTLLQKIGVEPQVFYEGKFKSATEPFRLDSMSKENKYMTGILLNDIQDRTTKNIAVSRDIPVNKLDSINKNFLVHTAYDAKRYGLVDDDEFEDDVFDYIRHQLHIGEKDKISFIPIEKYLKTPSQDTNT